MRKRRHEDRQVTVRDGVRLVVSNKTKGVNSGIPRFLRLCFSFFFLFELMLELERNHYGLALMLEAEQVRHYN